MHPRYGHITGHLIPRLERLRRQCLRAERERNAVLRGLPQDMRAPARNLLHYLALRRHDLRELQKELADIGLSRLARSEDHTLASIDAVLDALRALAGLPPARRRVRPPVTLPEAGLGLQRHASRLLGTGAHGPRLMLTMPGEAASRPELIRQLLAAGMEVMRINCAHDDADAWRAMVGHLRAAQADLGRACKIYVDLAGPKLRTGRIRPAGRGVEFAPRRDVWGEVTEPARLWLTSSQQPEPPPLAVDAVLPLDAGFLDKLQVLDRLELEDCRGDARSIEVVDAHGRSWLARSRRHIYFREGAACIRRREGAESVRCAVGQLPEVVQPLLLHAGERLLLVPDSQEGQPADEGGPARIPCTLDAVFLAALPGQAVWFDDGRIGARVLANRAREVELEITHAMPRGSRLRPEKGINLPDTELDTPAMTAKDRADLEVMAPHADIVGLSFVRGAADVALLHDELRRLDALHLGTVFKIETRQGFENLPAVLLAGLRQPPMGIMVARGDLAVEVGFERLAEVQEEILWLCEAAHVPVIWATQVLDTMARRGMPSRAEVSDAALSVRAEAVMLNKGPYIVETTRFLAGVLERMRAHQIKNRPVMRRLAVSRLTAR